MKNLLMTAPSGGGKSSVLREIKDNRLYEKKEREETIFKPLDFDTFGYRDKQGKWVIPAKVVSIFNQYPLPVLAGGMCSNIEEVIDAWKGRVVFFTGYTVDWLIKGGKRRIEERLNTWGWHQKPVVEVERQLQWYVKLVEKYSGKQNVITLDITKQTIKVTTKEVMGLME